MNETIKKLAKEYKEADRTAEAATATLKAATDDQIDNAYDASQKAWKLRNFAANVLAMAVCSELGI